MTALVEDPPAAEQRDTAPRTSEPAWTGPALVALLVGTAALYLWGLDRSGWANGYYAAAAQAGGSSWRAMLFGALDAGNGITVDKAPGFLWPMALSVRVFGASSWSVLVPQALMGVGSVAVLQAAVRRWYGAPVGLLAGLALATTPVAALMFRYDNPDASLVLLLTMTSYALVRALEGADTRWLVIAGALAGTGFLAKMLQAFIVVPGFALTYVLAAPTSLAERVRQLAKAAVAFVVGALWWPVLVTMWPIAHRPYIGGSEDNSVWNLLFGFNGLGRLTGRTNLIGPTGQPTKVGSPGLYRLVEREMGDYASWLLLAALGLGVLALVVTQRTPAQRTTRIGLGVFGSWLLAMGLTISFGKGIIHGYYTAAFTPALAATAAIAVATVWRHRADGRARRGLAIALGVTVAWSAMLLHRAPDWHPLVAFTLLVVGPPLVALVVGLDNFPKRIVSTIAVASLGLALAGPVAWTMATVARGHGGTTPLPGPPEVARTGIGAVGRADVTGPLKLLTTTSRPGRRLTALLREDSGDYRWTAATVLGQQAAGYQLASGAPVLALGGHDGIDPSPTLAEFKRYVRGRQVHWFIPNQPYPLNPFAAEQPPAVAIVEWVRDNFRADVHGGVLVYDLTARVD